MSRPQPYRNRQPLLPKVVHLLERELTLGEADAMRSINARIQAERDSALQRYQTTLKTIESKQLSAHIELKSLVAARAAEAARQNDPECRKRQPLAITHRWADQRDGYFVPPTVTSEILEARIDEICGCGGKYDCDCVSVFNQAKRELWGEHNGMPRATAESRRKEAVDG